MAVLFAVGVMNLAWIAALSVFVLLEKIIPRGFLGGQDCRAFPDGLGWLGGPFGRSLGRGWALCAGK
jgi:hypothetical protein